MIKWVAGVGGAVLLSACVLLGGLWQKEVGSRKAAEATLEAAIERGRAQAWAEYAKMERSIAEQAEVDADETLRRVADLASRGVLRIEQAHQEWEGIEKPTCAPGKDYVDLLNRGLQR